MKILFDNLIRVICMFSGLRATLSRKFSLRTTDKDFYEAREVSVTLLSYHDFFVREILLLFFLFFFFFLPERERNARGLMNV